MGVNGKLVFVYESEAIKPLLGIFDEKQPIVPFESKESIEYRFVFFFCHCYSIFSSFFLIIDDELETKDPKGKHGRGFS